MQIVQASSAMSMGALRAPPLSLVPARPLEAIPRIQTHAAAPTSAFPAPSCYVCASRQRRATPFMFANETIGDEVGPRVDAARDDSAAGTWQALLALNAAALIWGSQHAVIKSLVESIGSPAVLNAARFSIAAAAALPWWPGAPWRSSDETSAVDAEARAQSVSTTWAAGAELGVWTFLGFGLQAISLQYTTATRSAFLLYLNVKLVPILALLLYGRQSPLQTWISALIAFSGTGKSRKSPLPFSPICHRPPPPPPICRLQITGICSLQHCFRSTALPQTLETRGHLRRRSPQHASSSGLKRRRERLSPLSSTRRRLRALRCFRSSWRLSSWRCRRRQLSSSRTLATP